MMVKKFLKFSLILLLLVVISSCRRSFPILELNNEPLPTLVDGSTHTKEEVRNAIFKGCRRRGWVAQPKGEGLIEASIVVRENKARVEIRYNETTISILHNDSYNLRYADGTVHPIYNRWITYLYRDILRELDPLAYARRRPPRDLRRIQDPI